MANIRLVCIFIFFTSLFSLMIFPVSGVTNITHTEDGKILISNGTNWMKIDPVGDIIVGNPIIITGTTNLPVGSKINVQIFIAEDKCRQKTCDIDVNTFARVSSSVVQESGSGVNTFSMPIDTCGMIPSDYFFQFFSQNSDLGVYSEPIALFPQPQNFTGCSAAPVRSSIFNANGTVVTPLKTGVITTTMSQTPTKSSPVSVFVNIIVIIAIITCNVLVQKIKEKQYGKN